MPNVHNQVLASATNKTTSPIPSPKILKLWAYVRPNGKYSLFDLFESKVDAKWAAKVNYGKKWKKLKKKGFRLMKMQVVPAE